MKKIIFITITLLSMTYTIVAQNKTEKSVADAVENLRQAMISADQAKLNELVAEELSYGHSNGNVEDKKAFIEALTSGKSDFVSIELSEQNIKISGDVALVRHKLFAETNNNGQAGTVKLYILLIWQKQKGKWKLLARQAVRVA